MLASFRALQAAPEEIWLLLPRELVEDTRTSLAKYIVFSKAKLVDLSDLYTHLGFVGRDATSLLETQLGKLPAEPGDWCQGEGYWLIKLAEDRYHCGFSPTADQRREALAAQTQPLSDNYWTLQEIRAGLGEVRASTRELFTPQSLNFQLVNGINFRKGCYTGQEIVARLHYRASLKRHMYRLGCDWPENQLLPVPGSRLINGTGQNIGELIITAFSGPARIELLANLPDDQLNDAFLETGKDEITAKKLEPLSLPYAIPKSDAP
jgi:folate-binding protein YgfZ